MLQQASLYSWMSVRENVVLGRRFLNRRRQSDAVGRIVGDLGLTMVLVTRDLDEAIALSDRVVGAAARLHPRLSRPFAGPAAR